MPAQFYAVWPFYPPQNKPRHSDDQPLLFFFLFFETWSSEGCCALTWRLVPFWESPDVKALSDTDHQTTNSLSQSLYNSASAAESNSMSSTPKSQPLCGGSHVYSNHGWEGWGRTWMQNRGEIETERTPTPSVCPFGSKRSKPLKPKYI